jgi:hypothetical protein
MARPINPYAVLALAILLPGVGHVATGRVQRGLVFAFFTVLFMALTYMSTTPEHSFIGRHAGGLFIWALSIPDAYRRARMDYLSRVPAPGR